MNFLLKTFICSFSILLLSTFNISSQHLIGVKRNSLAQNYKLTSNSNARFEGYTQKQIDKEELRNKKNQENAKKELLLTHINKQSKAVRKRMKKHLKMVNNKSKKIVFISRWITNHKRKKILSQRKENKYDD
tara:strand:+ start:5102 stop:5497 length:396 start_codon:yes stop_codon:yes gene_type:complete